MQEYTEICLSTVPYNPDYISGILWQFDLDGITEYDDHLKIYISGKTEEKMALVVKIMNMLKADGDIEDYHMDTEVIQNRDWNKEWEAKLKVMEIGKKIVIKPTFKDYKNPGDKIVIELDPKMSFGTGEHQTTRLALEELEQVVKPGMRALDVGTGTGILAIAALKLGAEEALAIDIDDWCILNSIENSQLNDVTDKMEIKKSELRDTFETGFDLILANINKHILKELPGEVSKRMKREGILILSGLLREDEKEIKMLYENKGLIHSRTRVMDEWISMVFIK